jgi:glycosyltransferase involved in cell wall biosynthesis
MLKISVVIPTKQRREMVKRAVASVLSQTLSPDQVIVVDDASTDQTMEMLRALKDDRLVLVESESAGAAQARNFGIQKATGDLIAFCDSDDVWLPDKLEKQIPLFSAAPMPVMVFSDALVAHNDKFDSEADTVFSSQTPFSGEIFNSLLLDNFIPTSTVIIYREAIKKTSGFEDQYCPAEDYGLWLQLAKQGRCTFHPEPLAVYHQHAGQAGRRLGDMYTQTAKVIHGALNRSELRHKDVPGVTKRLWTLRHAAAACRKAEGENGAAFQQLDEAALLRPCHVGTRLKRVLWGKAVEA